MIQTQVTDGSATSKQLVIGDTTYLWVNFQNVATNNFKIKIIGSPMILERYSFTASTNRTDESYCVNTLYLYDSTGATYIWLYAWYGMTRVADQVDSISQSIPYRIVIPAGYYFNLQSSQAVGANDICSNFFIFREVSSEGSTSGQTVVNQYQNCGVLEKMFGMCNRQDGD